MSQKHESIEARWSVLRTELAAAIEAHTLASAHVARIKTAHERGKVLLDGAEQKVAELEVSARDFERRCINDNAFAILTAIETGVDEAERAPPVRRGCRDNVA
jgi:hypothetical protein